MAIAIQVQGLLLAEPLTYQACSGIGLSPSSTKDGSHGGYAMSVNGCDISYGAKMECSSTRRGLCVKVLHCCK